MPETQLSAEFSLQSVVNSPRQTPAIEYPEDLPVSARRDEIATTIDRHQVVILSGETGSGKTTQLPKICLALGRGLNKMIAHTQPRRLAASSVAKRIAQELKSELGDWVGYQIRFQDKSSKTTAIKLMTDGILLAESQRDPLLNRYDTIIIDEAHERSLNIDFLLGYLLQLLPRRPDLKLIITSATIDATRFARHFADANGNPAPVIEVSGRLFPVDIRYRPIKPDNLADGTQVQQPQAALAAATNPSARDEERELVNALLDAVDECARAGSGDILVFLPGEREIREAAIALRKTQHSSTQILPLYARLSQEEQEQIFKPKTNARRVVLATNVAETSLTVPGIRFVIDSGLARVKRYSWRNKVEQLRIEPVSQASANQRAGRCGRLGPGICIRLYDEIDFKQRDAFTDPEILRASLASVILRMKSLGWDEIEQFPFVDPPTGRAIADGYHLLQELGAISQDVEQGGSLTATGKSLAKLPLDPRIGRMILAARDQHCMAEMLVVAAALSVQDPRDRPMQARELADQAHSKFADDKSEFLTYLKLWTWYHEQLAQKLPQRKLVALLRQNFLSPMRMREWHDIHHQLKSLIDEHGWRLNQTEATYEQLHLALMAGLLGNLGLKSEESTQYLGARDIKFWINPGSKLAKKAGKWIMAAEIMDTGKLYARCVAKIDPTWIERIAKHLLRKSWFDHRWEKKLGQVVANERATLYGLHVYSGRRVHYGPIDPKQAREIFILQGLVPGEINSSLPFVVQNRKLIEQIEKLEHQSRRPDILVDDSLIKAFYEAALPEGIHQTATLEHWYKGLSKEEAAKLVLTRDALMRHEAAGVTTEVFPKILSWQGVDLAVDYHFEPGSPRDGITLTVPLYFLNKVDADRCEWLVPGMLKEKALLLLKSLPQKIRRHCVPLPDYAAGFYERYFDRLGNPSSTLIDALIADVAEQLGIRPTVADFKTETLPAHLFMSFKVVDEHGRMLTAGRNLAQIRADLGKQAQSSFTKMVTSDHQVAKSIAHDHLTEWTFGELPELLEIKKKSQTVIGYPALVDQGSDCSLDVFDEPQAAALAHRKGLLRLFKIGLKEQVKFLEKNLHELTKLGMLFLPLGTQEQLRDQIIDRAIDLACLNDKLPTDAQSFEAKRIEGRVKVGLLAQEVARLAGSVLEAYTALIRKLPQAKAYPNTHQDILQQIQALITRDFVSTIPQAQLTHVPRYLKAAATRIEKLRSDSARDAKLMAEMVPLLSQYARTRSGQKGAADPALDEFRWLLEELRVALFAQELRTPMPVSVKRLEKAWATMQR